MNNTDYQNLPAISSHWLIAMLESPAACWRQHLDPARVPAPSSDACRFGSAVHCLALTPRRFEWEFVVADYERRSLAGKAYYAQLAATGRIIVRPAEFEKALAIVAALRAHPEARKLLRGGKKERTIIQPRPGLFPLKARLDIHHEGQRHVVELKTIRDLGLIRPSMERYRYPLSAAFYRMMTKSQATTFVFVQTAPPHTVEIVDFPREQLQAGHEQWQTALARFDECWLANDWPEAEPATPDDDPLLMDFMPAKAAGRPRFELPVGELSL
jgi:hypothetical protein